MDTLLQKQTDEKLFSLIKQNNETAIATLLNRYKSKFYTVAYMLVKDQYIAEDIFQDACIKIITSIRQGKYNEDGRFIPWAMRITRNLAMDHLRLLKKMPLVTLPDGQDIFSILNFSEGNVQSKWVQEEEQNQVYYLLKLIPYEQREVIVLRLFGNLSFKEIAELVGINLNTALGRMRYGIASLRKAREKSGMLQ
jgi:RNA polymerase sigma factor (sigma-70 family)